MADCRDTKYVRHVGFMTLTEKNRNVIHNSGTEHHVYNHTKNLSKLKMLLVTAQKNQTCSAETKK